MFGWGKKKEIKEREVKVDVGQADVEITTVDGEFHKYHLEGRLESEIYRSYPVFKFARKKVEVRTIFLESLVTFAKNGIMKIGEDDLLNMDQVKRIRLINKQPLIITYTERDE